MSSNKNPRLIVFVIAFIAVGICLTTSCTQINSNAYTIEDISVEEATLILDQAIQYADEHDLDGLCGMGGSLLMCQYEWRYAGEWDAVPPQSPEIIDTYIRPQKDLGNGAYAVGGRVLVLEGTDGLGRHYQTDFFVFHNDETGELAARFPIYWSGMELGDISDEGWEVTPTEPE